MTADGTSSKPEPILFEANIVPHRSLTAAGRRWVALGLIAMCGATAIRFWFVGAWPVAGFCAVEGLIAAALIYCHARWSRSAELVMLTPSRLSVVRTSASGAVIRESVSSAWLNVRMEERPGRVSRLTAGVRANRIELGAALGEEQKRDLADALRVALERSREPDFSGSGSG